MQLYRLLTQLDEERQRAYKISGERGQEKRFGLPARQSVALFCIKELTALQPAGISLKALAQHMDMAASAASIMVDSMVKKNLLLRDTAFRDRRAVRISLTQEGEKLFSICNDALLARMSELAQLLTQSELRTLQRVVQKICGKIIN